jgi:Na+/melibiose symporter-like transporter
MSEQPATSDNGHHGPGLGGTWPGPAPRQPNQRRQTAVWCGALAGIGVGIMVATLIHAIEQANPNGSYSGFGGTVVLVVVIGGALLGFGLGGVAAALIPADEPRREAQPSHVAGAETAKGS